MAHSSRTWTGARSPQGKKRVRQAERRNEILQPRRSAAKTLVKSALVAAGTGEPEQTQAAVILAVSALDRAAKVGAIHPNAAARRKSRLMLKVNASLCGRRDRDLGQGRTPDQQGTGRQGRQGTHRSGQGDQGQGRADRSGQGARGDVQDHPAGNRRARRGTGRGARQVDQGSGDQGRRHKAKATHRQGPGGEGDRDQGGPGCQGNDRQAKASAAKAPAAKATATKPAATKAAPKPKDAQEGRLSRAASRRPPRHEARERPGPLRIPVRRNERRMPSTCPAALPERRR